MLNELDEWHLFGVVNLSREPGKKVYSDMPNSICKKMKSSSKLDQSERLVEQEMREYAAELGRQVCGTCISNLYLTSED